MKEISARSLLVSLGIGQFNATGVIPFMMFAPATTDPKSPAVVLLVQHLQRLLFGMGAHDVVENGHLDEPTAHALEHVVGPGWERMTWAKNVAAVLAARERGVRIVHPVTEHPGMPVAVAGPLDFLPDVPGGALTYAVAGFLLWRHLAKKKGTAR